MKLGLLLVLLLSFVGFSHADDLCVQNEEGFHSLVFSSDRYHNGLEYLEFGAAHDLITATATCVLSADGILDHPIILVESVDISQIINDVNMTWAHTLALVNGEDPFSGNGPVSSALMQGADFIIIDFTEPLLPIQNQAYLIESVINQVNSENDSSSQNVVVGLSQGGLTAKYALMNMESRNIEHNTSHFISYDTPHVCAHMSNGIILSSILAASSKPVLQGMVNFLFSMPARQMYCDFPFVGENKLFGEFEYSSQFKDQLDLEFEQFNFDRLPSNTVNVAISNGSLLAKRLDTLIGEPLIEISDSPFKFRVNSCDPLDAEPGGYFDWGVYLNSSHFGVTEPVKFKPMSYVPVWSAVSTSVDFKESTPSLNDVRNQSAFDYIFFPKDGENHSFLTMLSEHVEIITTIALTGDVPLISYEQSPSSQPIGSLSWPTSCDDVPEVEEPEELQEEEKGSFNFLIILTFIIMIVSRINLGRKKYITV